MQNPKRVDRFYTKMQERAVAAEGEPPREFCKSLPCLWTNIVTVFFILILALAALYQAFSAILFGTAALIAWPYLQIVLSVWICAALLLHLFNLLKVFWLKGPVVEICDEGLRLRQWSSRAIGWHEMRNVDRVIMMNPLFVSASTLIIWIQADARDWSRSELLMKPLSLAISFFSNKVPIFFKICAAQRYGGIIPSIVHYRKLFAPEAEDLSPPPRWRT